MNLLRRKPAEPPRLRKNKYTESDFDSMVWESLQVLAVTLPSSSAFANEMVGLAFDKELIFDIDCTIGGQPDKKYWHAPATLEFHGITDLNANFSSSDSGFQNGTSTFNFDGIERERVENQKVHLDRPYYRWSIQLVNPCQSGHLTFGAYGFTFLIGKAILSKPPF